jgi:trans-aconitate 2-methyltransferase
MSTWNPTQYLRFGNERLQPALDLLSRIPLEDPSTIYDLGCGTGTVTAMLQERWPGANVTGIDSSETMLERAAALDTKVAWQQQDLNDWTPEPAADFLYSNAVLHWLDDHEMLFPRLMQGLNPGGVLAVQMPGNFSAPTHTLIAETARAGHWRELLEPELREQPVLDPTAYYDILSPHATRLDFWETSYLHVLQGDDPVVEWTKGSILGPLLALLDDTDKEAFLEAYRAPISKAYIRRGDGSTLLPFRRLFLIAVK